MSSNSSTPGGGFQAARRLLAPAAACAALIVPGAAASETTSDPLAGLSLPGTAAYQQLGAMQPPGPPAEQPTVAELVASRTAYAELADAEALALLRREHETVVEADPFPDLDPPAGDEVTYESPFTAVVGDDLPAEGSDDPDATGFDPGAAPLPPGEGGRNVLVESSVPVAAREDGDLTPVDGDLDATGGSYTVENAVVEAEMPVELANGIELPEVDATVTPASTDGADAVPVADKLFYPSSDTDTDTLVTPTPTGVEIFFQLRSPQAPEANAIMIDVPAGTGLVATADGGAAVVEGGETVVAIPPASAWDAAQRPIPVRYEIAGERLTVVANIDEARTLWPVVVDPILDYYPWNDPGQRTNPNLTNWYAHNIGGRNINQFFAEEQGGVMNRFQSGWFANGDWAQWVATPIRQSYIETVQFWNVSHAPSAPGSCAWMAIWSVANWTWGGVWDSDVGSATPGHGAWRCGPVNHVSYAHYSGSDPYPDGENYGDRESADGSVGIFGLYQNGSGTRSAPADDVLRSATVWRGDRNNPGIPDLPTSNWTTTPDVPLTDAGLGVEGFGVYDPATNTWPGGGGPACDGSHASICPSSVRLPITGLPEGRHDYELQAFDPLWNASPRVSWTARIDRSAPAIAMSGALMNQQVSQGKVIRPNESYALSVNATDGTTASPGRERSGVRWTSVLVDGHQVAGTSPQSCPQGNCAASTTWTFNAAAWGPGPHEVSVFAIDQLGHSTSREIVVGVGGSPTNSASSCTLGPEEATTAADEAALAASEPAPEIPEQPDRGSACVESGARSGSHRAKGCRRINHRETWTYPTGAFAYWLSYSSRFCWNENTGKAVKRGESYLEYDLSDFDTLTTDMEHYGEAAPVYERWGGANRGKVIMEADFELEECFAIVEFGCDTKDRHLFNRGRADGSARMYFEE